MKAYHGDRAIKERYLARVRAHREADELVKGQYWEDGKGCAVGCTIHGGDHSKYETALGIPETLAHLEDTIFEHLTNGDSKEWPERFLSAPRVGADLSLVWPQFARWLLVDPEHGVIRFAGERMDARTAIERVGELHRQWVETGVKPSPEEWKEALASEAAAALAAAAAWAAVDAAWAANAALAATEAATDAAENAALAATEAAENAALAATEAAENAALAATDAAENAALATAAWVEAWKRMADKLIELMEAAPVGEEAAA